MNLAGTTGDARKRIEAEHAAIEADRYGGFCQCGHGHYLHCVVRPDRSDLACVCGCRGFVAA